VVGVATAIYWIVKALLEFPVGTLLDKYAGEKDDYFFLVSGFSLPPLFLLVIFLLSFLGIFICFNFFMGWEWLWLLLAGEPYLPNTLIKAKKLQSGVWTIPC